MILALIDLQHWSRDRVIHALFVIVVLIGLWMAMHFLLSRITPPKNMSVRPMKRLFQYTFMIVSIGIVLVYAIGLQLPLLFH